jgi:anti-anti-sigma factor
MTVATSAQAAAGPDDHTCHTARFSAHRLSDTTEVITAVGELDASNSQAFVEFALRNAATTKVLILDLTGVEFFGTAGFSALHTFNVQCAGERVEWALVPGTAVNRVLRICDPDATLPASDSVEDASAELVTDQERSLHLVPESH